MGRGEVMDIKAKSHDNTEPAKTPIHIKGGIHVGLPLGDRDGNRNMGTWESNFELIIPCRQKSQCRAPGRPSFSACDDASA